MAFSTKRALFFSSLTGAQQAAVFQRRLMATEPHKYTPAQQNGMRNATNPTQNARRKFEELLGVATVAALYNQYLSVQGRDRLIPARALFSFLK